jgi:hypothetical protein
VAQPGCRGGFPEAWEAHVCKLAREQIVSTRKYWGQAGGSLIGISIASAIAEFIALTTTDRSHVPLWPLAVCAAIFFIGLALFLFREREEPSALQVVGTLPEYADREFAYAGPKEILQEFQDHTEIQANKLVRPHYGKWLRAHGPLQNVDSWDASVKYATATLSNYTFVTGNGVFFKFCDKDIVEGRLAVLKRGTPITIIGKIDSIQPYAIWLKDCEIESGSSHKQIADPPRQSNTSEHP